MKVSTFFTYFWILYFPLCVAFNDISILSSVDELMTLILISYTWNKKGPRIINKSIWREFYQFLWILTFYVIYSLILAVNVYQSVFLDLVQQIRPYSVLYCTWILAPQFSRKQKKRMLYAMVGTLFLWAAINMAGVDKAQVDSVTGQPIEVAFPVLGQLAISTGMAFYLFSKETKRNRYMALGLVFVGLLAPKMKFVGEVVCFIGIFFFIKKKVKLNLSNILLFGTPMLLAVLFFAWDKVDAYFISGAENENLARPMLYKNSIRVLFDYIPFGSGMGTYGTFASAKYFCPLYYEYKMDEIWGFGPKYGGAFVCDAYFSSLAQFGFVGIFFFITFWKRRLKDISKIQDIRYYRVAIMAALCLAIENTADSSYLSGKGMGYFMLLGLCLASLKYQQPKRIVRIENHESDDGGLCAAEQRGSGIGNPNDGTNAAVERV